VTGGVEENARDKDSGRRECSELFGTLCGEGEDLRGRGQSVSLFVGLSASRLHHYNLPYAAGYYRDF